MDASLKQRLVGAAVLVALAVIFLPLLVKGPAPDSGVSDVSLRVPPEPKAPDGTVTQDLPLVAPSAAPAGGVAGMPEAATPVEAASAAPAAEPAPLAAVAAGGFAVGFGNYASEGDADKVIAALRAAGLPGYREPITLGGRAAQRVRIGPFADRATAESARLRAGQVRSDVDTRVVVLDAATPDAEAVPTASPLPATPAPKPASTPPPAAKPAGQVAVAKPSESKPATVKPAAPASAAATEPAPAKPANPSATGFVVQIGAFSSGTDALAQRDALRKAGFNAFTDTVPGPNGTLTRVRVGPVVTRAEADALKAKLRAVGKDGMVRPHP